MLEKYLPRIKFDSYEDFKKNYKVNVPDDFNFGFDIVDGWAKESPEKRALIWCNDNGGEKILTFTDIKKYSNRIANFLLAQGVRKGDRVILMLKQRWQYWCCATALHKIGAVLIPATVQLTKKDIVYRVQAAEARFVIATEDHKLAEEIEAAAPECPTLIGKAFVGKKRDGWFDLDEEMEKYSDVLERKDIPEDTKSTDLFIIYFTSGTTGMPKMVAHDCTYPIGHIVTAKYWQNVQDNELHMTLSDSGWAKFGWGKIYGQWIAGATIFAYDEEKFSPARVMEMIAKYRVTTFCAPPTMYRFFIKEDLSKYDWSSVKHAAIAGEPLNPEVFNQFRDATGIKVYEGFGQTESSVMMANFRGGIEWEDGLTKTEKGWVEPRPGSTGKPSPLYDIDLIDEEGNSVPDGVEGDLVVRLDKGRPYGLFVGYFKDGKITDEHITNGVYNLHDRCYRDSDGYYWFVGRGDDVIKCSGYRIGPFEVESALVAHPAVLECAVTAVPDPVRGQVVKATIVLAKGYEPSDALTKELQDHVKHTTAPYKYPRVVEYVSELPKTLGGKIKRALIRKNDAEKA